VSLVISAGLAAVGDYLIGAFPGLEIILRVVNFVVSFAVITAMFALLFKYVPDAEIEWGDVWLGAAVTALLFTLGRFALSLYIEQSDFNQTYGAAATIIVLLLWVYYSAQILFFGAEFTQVYANQYGSRVVPEPGAIALTEEKRREQGIAHEEDREAAQRESEPAAQPAGMVPVTGYNTQTAPPARPREPQVLPEAQPSILAISAVFTALAGFLSGWAIRRGARNQKK
jgi:membrane protein